MSPMLQRVVRSNGSSHAPGCDVDVVAFAEANANQLPAAPQKDKQWQLDKQTEEEPEEIRRQTSTRDRVRPTALLIDLFVVVNHADHLVRHLEENR